MARMRAIAVGVVWWCWEMCGVVEEGCVVPDHGGRAPHDGDVSYPCWAVRGVVVG